MDCFVARAPRNDEGGTISRSRRMFLREVFIYFLTLQSEGAGNTGCTLHPRSREQTAQNKTPTSIQVQRRQSGIPCAMVLRLMPCSPPRSGFLVTVIGGALTADLTPASRRPDHT